MTKTNRFWAEKKATRDRENCMRLVLALMFAGLGSLAAFFYWVWQVNNWLDCTGMPGLPLSNCTRHYYNTTSPIGGAQISNALLFGFFAFWGGAGIGIASSFCCGNGKEASPPLDAEKQELHEGSSGREANPPLDAKKQLLHEGSKLLP